MRIFNLNNEYSIVCNWQNTRYGFRHLATLHKAGFEIAEAKVCYYNRTWERFEFESVLNKIIKDNFTGRERDKFLEVIKKLE
jgi:hypothetical protein